MYTRFQKKYMAIIMSEGKIIKEIRQRINNNINQLKLMKINRIGKKIDTNVHQEHCNLWT